MEADRSHLRASDADREAVADALSAHAAAGRLDVAELDQRLAAAFDARTLGELDELLWDLPRGGLRTRLQTPPQQSTVKAGPPGLWRFHQRHELAVDREIAFRQANEHIVPSLVRAGYDVVERAEPQLLVFERRERPAWVILVCILAFPVGLLALMVRNTHRIVVTFDELDQDRTRLVVQGTARRGVRKAFASLAT